MRAAERLNGNFEVSVTEIPFLRNYRIQRFEGIEDFTQAIPCPALAPLLPNHAAACQSLTYWCLLNCVPYALIQHHEALNFCQQLCCVERPSLEGLGRSRG